MAQQLDFSDNYPEITKITSQFIRLKKRFVATFSAKKNFHMGAFFRN